MKERLLFTVEEGQRREQEHVAEAWRALGRWFNDRPVPASTRAWERYGHLVGPFMETVRREARAFFVTETASSMQSPWTLWYLATSSADDQRYLEATAVRPARLRRTLTVRN
jgi:hypothetical protein